MERVKIFTYIPYLPTCSPYLPTVAAHPTCPPYLPTIPATYLTFKCKTRTGIYIFNSRPGISLEFGT
jgi:hypothetical protein